MTRIKVLFLSLSILMFIPIWRYLDIVQVIWSSTQIYATLFFLSGLLFISLPLLILKLKKAFFVTLSLLLLISGFHYSFNDFSHPSSENAMSNHCGVLTYSGTFYPLIHFMTPSHADDLEIRNQLCWIRKIISETPQKIQTSHELDSYLNNIQNKLLNIDYKFRTSLPLIGLLHLVIFSKYSDLSQNTAETNGKMLIETLNFWQQQYTYEINSKNYPWWDFPHGPYVKFEYGLVEKNWDAIIDFIQTIEIQ